MFPIRHLVTGHRYYTCEQTCGDYITNAIDCLTMKITAKENDINDTFAEESVTLLPSQSIAITITCNRLQLLAINLQMIAIGIICHKLDYDYE